MKDNRLLIKQFIETVKIKSNNDLKKRTSPIMGWSNTYIPEEILISGGFLSYRVMGAPVSLSLSKTYLSGNLCSYVQSLLECALNGD